MREYRDPIIRGIPFPCTTIVSNGILIGLTRYNILILFSEGALLRRSESPSGGDN